MELKVPENHEIFCCNICAYSTSRSSQLTRHLSTAKHEKHVNASKMLVMASKKVPEKSLYECNCGKIYKHDSSYYKHKKNCNIPTISADCSNNDTHDKDLIMLLIKENSELKHLMMDVIKTGTHNITHTNSHNKTFNLQFFLNETCKHAMNITDFVDSVKLQLADLENMGDVGYVNGMSNIILKNLKDLDISERPIHCTDTKRDILYVKDKNKWDKEIEGNPKIRKAIKYIAHKNSKLLVAYREKHPDCTKSNSKHSDTYNKLLVESMGGIGDDEEEKENKIIRKLTKDLIVDK